MHITPPPPSTRRRRCPTDYEREKQKNLNFSRACLSDLTHHLSECQEKYARMSSEEYSHTLKIDC